MTHATKNSAATSTAIPPAAPAAPAATGTVTPVPSPTATPAVNSAGVPVAAPNQGALDAVAKGHIPTGRAMWVMMALMLGSNLLASFNQSLMNIALDGVAAEFHVSLSVANWMVLGFTIVAATVITMAASLLKRYGIRRVMTFGYAASLAGSLLGFFAWDFFSMLAARIIQALTVGLFFPVVTSVILTMAPKGKKGTMLAINSGAIGVGLAFAPLVAGLLITYTGLRTLFLVPAVLSVALLVLGYFFLHDIYQRENRPIDALSVVMSFVGLGLFIYGLNEITRTFVPSVVFMIAGALVLGLFSWRQFRIKDPLLNLSPFQHPKFVTGELLMMLGYMGSIYMSLLVPLYLEGAAGYTAFIAGCLLAAPILCYAGACFVGGHIEDRHGIWPLVPGGFLLILLGFIAMMVFSSIGIALAVVACAALSYIGVGLVFPTLKAVDLGALPAAIYSHGSSIHSTLVQIAGSVGSALFVGIMSADADRLMATGATKASAYAFGFSHTIIISIIILAVAFVGATIFALIMRKKKPQA